MVICGGSFWFDRKEHIAGWQCSSSMFDVMAIKGADRQRRRGASEKKARSGKRIEPLAG